MNIDLTGRTSLVTGASRGIGAAIARSLSAAGADIIAVARDQTRLEEALGSVIADGRPARAVACDLSDPDAVRELAGSLDAVDVLVNNAGGGDKYVHITEPDDAYWHHTFQVDFFAPLTLTRELGRGMAERGTGSIINISSIAASVAMPLFGAYNCAKAALESLTRTTAVDLGPAGVRCNAVAPGVILTEQSERVLPDAARAFFAGQAPVGRLGTVEEVAALVTFLACDASSYLNGQTITLDGGTTTANAMLATALAAMQA